MSYEEAMEETMVEATKRRIEREHMEAMKGNQYDQNADELVQEHLERAANEIEKVDANIQELQHKRNELREVIAKASSQLEERIARARHLAHGNENKVTQDW